MDLDVAERGQIGSLRLLLGSMLAQARATKSKKTTQHRVIRAPRARTSRRFERYSVNPAFPYDYCYCIY
jgi:hypothetical protein